MTAFLDETDLVEQIVFAWLHQATRTRGGRWRAWCHGPGSLASLGCQGRVGALLTRVPLLVFLQGCEAARPFDCRYSARWRPLFAVSGESSRVADATSAAIPHSRPPEELLRIPPTTRRDSHHYSLPSAKACRDLGKGHAGKLLLVRRSCNLALQIPYTCLDSRHSTLNCGGYSGGGLGTTKDEMPS